jgi:cytochrome P450
MTPELNERPSTSRAVLPDFDLADPAFYTTEEPIGVWAKLREHDPIHLHVRPDGTEFWALTSYELVSQAFRAGSAFTSQKGMQLDSIYKAGDTGGGKALIVTDPPRHTALRAGINTAFTPRMVARLEQNMRVTVDAMLDVALEQGSFDFTEMAGKLPVSVVCDLLGVPRSDWDLMLRLTRTAFGDAATGTETAMDKLAAHAIIMTYYADLVRERRHEPADDVITALAHAKIDGELLSEEEIFLNCDGLISGGNETTRHAMTAGLLALIRDPAQWRALREDPRLVLGAVNEILRFTSPALHVLRTATVDMQIGGRTVRSGDRVTLWMPSANRDSRMFPDGDRFDVRRDARRHLAFGIGTHYCLGSSLASLELRVFFERFIARVASAECIGPIRRLASNLIWGIDAMPVLIRGA